MAGLTTMAGFGALALAANPALRGLGLLCALGVGTCLLSTFAIVLPLATKLPRPRKY
jgi:predicted RND superfamily exporter protein